MLIVLLRKQILIQKLDWKKITDHNHDKYITTPEFNTLSAHAFNARLARESFVAKTDFDNSASNLPSRIAANKTKKESIKN